MPEDIGIIIVAVAVNKIECAAKNKATIGMERPVLRRSIASTYVSDYTMKSAHCVPCGTKSSPQTIGGLVIFGWDICKFQVPSNLPRAQKPATNTDKAAVERMTGANGLSRGFGP
jgi:hypothetical protein